MYVIDPAEVRLTSSTVAEHDYPEWVASTNYERKDRVIVRSDHKVYEAAKDHVGVDPVRDEESSASERSWILVGATNRWKAFDKRLGDPVVGAGDIVYELEIPSPVTAMAMFGLDGAVRADVSVRRPDGHVVWSRSYSLVDVSNIRNWWTFFYGSGGQQQTQLVVGDLPGVIGYTLRVEIVGVNPRVSQIAYGNLEKLGTTHPGTEVGFQDFSRKDRDVFGNAILVKRDYADTVRFQMSIGLEDVTRVKDIVVRLRATPAVWFAGADVLSRGATVFGFPGGGLDVQLEAAAVHFATLEIEGMV